jgi:hypothetical protein
MSPIWSRYAWITPERQEERDTSPAHHTLKRYQKRPRILAGARMSDLLPLVGDPVVQFVQRFSKFSQLRLESPSFFGALIGDN